MRRAIVFDFQFFHKIFLHCCKILPLYGCAFFRWKKLPENNYRILKWSFANHQKFKRVERDPHFLEEIMILDPQNSSLDSAVKKIFQNLVFTWALISVFLILRHFFWKESTQFLVFLKKSPKKKMKIMKPKNFVPGVSSRKSISRRRTRIGSLLLNAN